MASCRKEALQLYKMLLRESSKFSSYNFRMYALRRVKDAFQEHHNETDPKKIEDLVSLGKQNLSIIKRQVVVGNLFNIDQLVIEKQGP